MIYTVTFNPAIDYVMNVSELVPGSVNRSSNEYASFGGKGLNVSFVLKELGKQSTALGFTAGFTGEAIERAVKQADIQSDFIRLPEGLSRINVKIKGKEETDLNGSGPNIPPSALNALFDKLRQLKDGDILVLAGSIPPSLPQNIYETILRTVSDRRIVCVVDATGALLSAVLPYRPFLVKPNHYELGELFGKTLTSREEIAFYAQKVREMGARNVLVSMAAKGALLADEQGAVHSIEAPDGKTVNSVGAGDSMVAGFLAGWSDTKSYAHALALGTAAGSATAFSKGLASRREIRELFEKMQGASS